MNYLFSKFFYLPLTGTFKNCTINSHILRWYEWDLLVFCKQTPLQLAAIGIFRWDHPKAPRATLNKISYCLINNDLC